MADERSYVSVADCVLDGGIDQVREESTLRALVSFA